jgi:hypothetical protein
LWRKFKIKFLLASTKLFTNSEHSFSKPILKAFSGFQVATCDSKRLFRKPPVILKIVLIAGYDTYAGENQPLTAKEIRIEILIRLSIKS